MTDGVPVHAVECPAEVFEVGVRVGAQSEGVRQADGIALDVTVAVQAPAVGDIPAYHVTVGKAFDILVVVARPHVV